MISASDEAPRWPEPSSARGLQAPLYDRGMSVDVLRWEGLLEGEELAYLGEEAARDARFADLPDGLDPRVRDAIGVDRALRAPARGVGRGGAGRARARHDRHRVREDARVQPARPRRARARAEDRARSTSTRRRRSRRTSSARCPSYTMPRLKPAIYDGDTPTEQRWQIRKWSNVILTNPDMVHVGLLPNHDRWGDVLANLRYVVVDEAHVYRGVFGSHVANVLRRLRRLARIYGAEPQFLLASATISNPGELGDRAARRAGDGRRRRRGAARRAHGRALEPAAAGRGARAARLAARRGGEAAGDVRRARPAHADVREEPQGGRADPPLHRRAARRRHAPLAVPRRLHRAAAPRDRAAAEGGRPARRLGDERARARDRRRPARLRDLGRLPGHGRVAAPAVGTRRPARAAGSRCWSRARTASTSSSCASPTSCSAGASRRRSSTTRTRACSPGTCARPPTRRRSTDEDAAILGPEALERRARRPGAAADAGRASSGPARDHPAARVALRSAEPDAFSIVDGSTGAVLGARRALARVLDRARGRDLPPPRRVVPRARAGPERRCTRSSSRSAATGTRRRRRRR